MCIAPPSIVGLSSVVLFPAGYIRAINQALNPFIHRMRECYLKDDTRGIHPRFFPVPRGRVMQPPCRTRRLASAVKTRIKKELIPSPSLQATSDRFRLLLLTVKHFLDKQTFFLLWLSAIKVYFLFPCVGFKILIMASSVCQRSGEEGRHSELLERKPYRATALKRSARARAHKSRGAENL